MKKNRIASACLVIVATFFASITAHAQVSTPQETLAQYVADLQKNPTDNALREKIIRHVQTMKKAPAIPEEAREHFVMAATFVEQAKDSSGYERAIEQYKAALLAAPWWADAYKKLAIIQKAAAHYDDAIASLRLYLLTQPADARDAQDEIYKLKALGQTAREDDARKQQEAQQRDAPKELLRQLKAQYDGASMGFLWCSHAPMSACFSEVGTFPCGCNESEYNGSNWYSRDDEPHRISFPENGTILVTSVWMNQQYSKLRGTPKGPNISDIAWELNQGGSGAPVWKPVWVDLPDGLNQIVYSPERYDAGAGRPIDSSLYNPNLRYSYILLKRQ
jgi:tetratricopeptide (TPR) repeat protein